MNENNYKKYWLAVIAFSILTYLLGCTQPELKHDIIYIHDTIYIDNTIDIDKLI